MVRALHVLKLAAPLLLIALGAPAGCNLVFPFEVASTEGGPVSDVGPGDVAVDSADAADSAADAPPALTFGPAQPVTELNTPSGEDDPTLTGDMLEIYFERNQDIWRATRASTAATWSSATQVVELSSADEDGTPDLAPDGLTIFFASRRAGAGVKGGIEVYVATRTSRTAAWGAPALVPELNTDAEDLCAAPTADLLTVVLDSTRTGGAGGRDLYLATRTDAQQPWGAPAGLVNVNGSLSEECPWIDATGAMILFSSDRAGSAGFDIWVTARTGSKGAYSAPALVQGINTSSNEGDPWLSPDGKTLYFHSDVSGSGDIYVAQRTP